MGNKSLLEVFILTLLAVSLIACGGGGKSTRITTDSSSSVDNTDSTDTSDTTDVTDAEKLTDTVASPPEPEPPAHIYSSRYAKLDDMGNELPPESESWACVQDKNTGLLWEAKTDDGSLRDKDWRFRHFHNSGGYASYLDYNGNILCQNIGSSSCDAYTYVNALNGSALCGRNNWRLPLMEELLGLVQLNADGSRPNIDLDFFPETINDPGKAAYCSENMNTYSTCGSNYTIPDGVDPNARAECNYQGVDYGLSIRPENIRGDSMVALRYYGEVQDGLPDYPDANWICHTRLVSGSF